MSRRRVALVAVGAACVAVFGMVPARADFHGLCTTGSGPTAYARLTTSGSTLTYTGLVKCVGRSVTIDAVTFTALDGNGRSSSGPLSASCTSCTGPISVAGTYELPGPGTYTVSMAFTVTGVAQRFRTHRAVALGPGLPLVTLCGGNDAANQQLSCPVTDSTVLSSNALDVDPPHDE